MKALLRRIVVLAVTLGMVFGQETWALAGTTGGVTGTIIDATSNAPVVGVKVTAASPSGVVATTTDAKGNYAFISLSPDTYSVSAQKDGYDDLSYAGVTIFADATQVVNMRMNKTLKTIARVTSRAAGDLVKPGTTADVYSINSATQSLVSGVGGGGGLNNAYSAIATVPGAYVPMNQQGYFQTVHVRGGDYDQLGYEVDGVPVNRSFDNYPGGTASSLGQQELQVYTGANPANSEGQGLAGYINQVIKSGTYPGFGQALLGVGTPSYYHHAAIEAGGASPDRRFSYYVGIGGYNNDNFLYVDKNQGNSYASNWGNLIGITPSGTYVMAPFSAYNNSGLANRDVVANFHVGIPHKHDGGKDDLQLLISSQFLKSTFYDSTNDIGQSTWAQLGGNPTYFDGLTYNGQLGAALPTADNALIPLQNTYLFPSSPTSRCANVPAGFTNACTGAAAQIDPNSRDAIYNDQEIVKLQYQKNFGSDAFLRMYGYTFYSDWLQTGPQTAYANYFGPVGPDYELDTHTYGFSAEFSKQFSPEHLITLQGNYTGANSLRNNNRTFYDLFGFGGAQTDMGVLVSAAHPTDGHCYDTTGTAQTCDPSINAASFVNFGSTSTPLGGASSPALPASCGGAACEYIAVENGNSGLYNAVKPEFTSLSLTDEWRPNDKLLMNVGLRYDAFKFIGADTSGGMRQFWFNAYNLDKCVDPTTGAPIDKSAIGGGFAVDTPCNTIPVPGSTQDYAAANLVNSSSQVFNYPVFQPRLSATYTVNQDTVLRGSIGRYVEPPNTAYEQYSAQQEDTADLLGKDFYKFGFNTPGHQVRPPTSVNTDFSLEKRLHNTDWSFKLTPFYRKTQDQIQNFFLDQKTGFISGLNVGSLTAKGLEFQLTKGDLTKNGFSGIFSFTYTNASIQYSTLSNGTTILSQTNQDIKNYNAYTSFCAANANDPRCAGGATSTGVAAGPCFAGGVAAPCGAGAVANPYWNAPVQSLIDPSQAFVPFDIFPGPVNSEYDSYNIPYTSTLILNYKHDKLAITPSFQWAAGGRYGAPETTPGVAPETCTGTLGSVVGDPRYPYGGTGLSYDNTTCAANLAAIPDMLTGHFDSPGEFRNPAQFSMNLQLSYQMTPRIQLIATFANIIDRCFGATGPGVGALVDSHVCSYSTLGSAVGAIAPFGNAYNPGDPAYTNAPAFLKYPYEPSFGAFNADSGTTNVQPFQFFIEAKIKL